MKFLTYMFKTLIENIRDWKILAFVLVFAPCFVFGMYAAMGKGNHSYNIAVINNDTAVNGHGSAVLKMLQELKHPDGVSKYKPYFASSPEEISIRLKNKSSDAGLIIPEGFSDTLENAAVNTNYKQLKVKLMGDPRNSRYSIASIYLLTDLDMYIKSITGTKTPVDWEEELVGSGRALTDFDFYIPGLIILAILNVFFTAGASLIKEVEKGTMQRLILSRLKSWQFIAAISVIQVLFCIISMLLTLLAANSCGYSFEGSFTVFLAVGIISGIAIMGITMISVSFIKTVFDLMTVGMLPYFAVLLFGGIFFPLPPVTIFTYGDSIFRLNDLIPLSISFSILNKTMNYGWGVPELGIDLAWAAVISFAFFFIGLSFFGRKHMRING